MSREFWALELKRRRGGKPGPSSAERRAEAEAREVERLKSQGLRPWERQKPGRDAAHPDVRIGAAHPNVNKLRRFGVSQRGDGSSYHQRRTERREHFSDVGLSALAGSPKKYKQRRAYLRNRKRYPWIEPQ